MVELNFKKVIFELDTKYLMGSFHSSAFILFEFDTILEDGRVLLNFYFEKSNAKFTRREAAYTPIPLIAIIIIFLQVLTFLLLMK